MSDNKGADGAYILCKNCRSPLVQTKVAPGEEGGAGTTSGWMHAHYTPECKWPEPMKGAQP